MGGSSPGFHTKSGDSLGAGSGESSTRSAEDDVTRNWSRHTLPAFDVTARGSRGLFAGIERWTDGGETGGFTGVPSRKDNVTTWYGKTRKAELPDPADATRIFSWLICESYDDKGNAVVYIYASENDESVDRSQANERNRIRSANRHLKRIRCGNRVSRLIDSDLTATEWLFEVVFDYDARVTSSYSLSIRICWPPDSTSLSRPRPQEPSTGRFARTHSPATARDSRSELIAVAVAFSVFHTLRRTRYRTLFGSVDRV